MHYRLDAGTVLDGYRLIRPLGQGGFGEVWLCVAESMGDYRALKFISIDDPELLEKEYAALVLYRSWVTRLRSPWLVAIEHANRNEQGLYYVMPLADGHGADDPAETAWEPVSLRGRIERQCHAPAWFSSGEILTMAAPILDGLQALAQAGLVHRDVKPDNILFFGGQPCLADISLLAADAPIVTRRGTPGYATPSWYLGGHPDMYGLAATLFTLLTGNEPDRMGRSAFLWPPHGEGSLSEIERGEWARLHAVIRRAIAEPVAERFIDFAAMRRALAGEETPATAAASANPAEAAGNARHQSSRPKRRGLIASLVGATGVATAVILWLQSNLQEESHLPVDQTKGPVQVEQPPPAQGRASSPRRLTDMRGNFPSLRERVMKVILWAVATNRENSLDLGEAQLQFAVRNAYQDRDYSTCLARLDDFLKKYPEVQQRPACLLFKALVLKQLKRDDESRDALAKACALGIVDACEGSSFELQQHLCLLEALAAYGQAESSLGDAITKAHALKSADNNLLIELHSLRARFRILAKNYPGALEDQRQTLALPIRARSGQTMDQARQSLLNTAVLNWELLEQEFPEYSNYLQANGWPIPSPDLRDLSAVD